MKISILDTFCVRFTKTAGAGGKVRFLNIVELAIFGGAAKQVAKAVELVQPQVFVVFWN